jgi:hypothetical protein
VLPAALDSFRSLMCASHSFLILGGRKIFRKFLSCEYSEENILFWLACEELKQEKNPEAIEEKARYIYEDYISILSPKEVSGGGDGVEEVMVVAVQLAH